jgi:hypothetical protein
VNAVRDSSGIQRLIRFAARMLLWGCVLLLVVRGIASEFSAPQTATTTRGARGTLSQPTQPVRAPEGK